MDQIIIFFLLSFYFRFAVSCNYIIALPVGNFIWPESVSCENYEILFYRLLNTSISDRYHLPFRFISYRGKPWRTQSLRSPITDDVGLEVTL
jgi:hypothetical protein